MTHWYEIDGAIGAPAPEDEFEVISLTMQVEGETEPTLIGSVIVDTPYKHEAGDWTDYCLDAPKDDVHMSDAAFWYLMYTADAPSPSYAYPTNWRAVRETIETKAHAPKDLKPAPKGLRTAIDSAEEVDATPRLGTK